MHGSLESRYPTKRLEPSEDGEFRILSLAAGDFLDSLRFYSPVMIAVALLAPVGMLLLLLALQHLEQSAVAETQVEVDPADSMRGEQPPTALP